MATQAISGRDGDVYMNGNLLCELSKWSIDFKANIFEYGSNCDSGYKRRVVGKKDCSGSIAGFYDPGNPPYTCQDNPTNRFQEGLVCTLRLYIDQYTYFDVPAIIENFSMEVEMAEGQLVTFTANFVGNGAWTCQTDEESSASSSSSSSSSTTNSSTSSS